MTNAPAAQRVGADVTTLDDRQRVLLIRRRDNGRWDVPGSGAHVGERGGDAARRGLAGETGVRVDALRPVGVFSAPEASFTYPDGNRVAWVTILYATHTVPTHPDATTNAGSDAAEARWCPLHDLPPNVTPITRAHFDAILTSAQHAPAIQEK